MKPLTVWILQTGEPLHIDGENARPMRAMNLSNALVEAGHKVSILRFGLTLSLNLVHIYLVPNLDGS
jgi:hypothetical protein